jgi:predicted lipoprotein with Yx(FWY)xxD motif
MRTRVFLIGALAAISLSLAACGDDDTTTTDGAGTTQAGGGGATTSAPSATTALAAADVNVATSSLGDILVDRDGLTLYVFLNDTAGTSTCVDACAQAWPPLIATTVAVGADLDEAGFSLVARPDGTQQLAVNDQPLYLFAGDAAPGDTAGQGFNSVWYVVGQDGTPIRTS